jgi:hypothetical protein
MTKSHDPFDPNEVAATLYAEVRRSTTTPTQAVGVLGMVLYIIWRESAKTKPYPLPDFGADIIAALYDLHSLNQEGTVQ